MESRTIWNWMLKKYSELRDFFCMHKYSIFCYFPDPIWWTSKFIIIYKMIERKKQRKELQWELGKEVKYFFYFLLGIYTGAFIFSRSMLCFTGLLLATSERKALFWPLWKDVKEAAESKEKSQSDWKVLILSLWPASHVLIRNFSMAPQQ